MSDTGTGEKPNDRLYEQPAESPPECPPAIPRHFCNNCGVILAPAEDRPIDMDCGDEYLCDWCLGISN